MKRKFWFLLLCLALASLSLGALASTDLQAAWRGGSIVVSWSERGAGCATLTVYNDGWPVLVTRVDCAAGCFTVPAAYTRSRGAYSVRLRTDSGCERTPVSGSDRPEAPAATAAPEPTPTAAPVMTPEPAPTAALTPAPVATAAPTAAVEPTPAPTAEHTPAATAAPAPTPTAAPTPVVTAAPTPTEPPRVTARPTATPRPTAAPSGSTSADLASQVVAQVNQERAAQGLSALRVDTDLTAAACVRAREIVEKFSHTRPDGSSWSTVSGKAFGENIAMGQRTADKVMAAWMSSQGHRENILRPTFGSIGVCAYQVNGVIYWVQLFGR